MFPGRCPEMLSAAITGPRDVSVREVADPKAGGNVVTVAIGLAPLCTEFKSYVTGAVSARLGHEAVGRVLDAAQSEMVKAGDRVVVMPQYGCGTCEYCRSGDHIYCSHNRNILEETGSEEGTATLAEVILKPDWLLLPVPDDMDLRHAAMACCGLGPGFNAIQRMGVAGPEVVLVGGCGPVGLGTVICARARGARVLAIEADPYRAELARRVGCSLVVEECSDRAIKQLKDFTGNRGVDAAVDTTNVEEVQDLILKSLRPLARFTYIGWGASANVPSIVSTGLQVNGCWHWNHKAHGPEMISVIRACTAEIDTAVTNTFGFSELGDAFELQSTGKCGKVFISINEEVA